MAERKQSPHASSGTSMAIQTLIIARFTYRGRAPRPRQPQVPGPFLTLTGATARGCLHCFLFFQELETAGKREKVFLTLTLKGGVLP